MNVPWLTTRSGWWNRKLWAVVINIAIAALAAASGFTVAACLSSAAAGFGLRDLLDYKDLLERRRKGRDEPHERRA
jgi:hypothetical protein